MKTLGYRNRIRSSLVFFGLFLSVILTVNPLVAQVVNPVTTVPSPLQEQIDLFLSLNDFTGLAGEVVNEVIINGAMDQVAMSQQIVDNTWVIDDDSYLLHVDGPQNQKQEYIDTGVTPLFVRGNYYSEAQWSWGPTTIVTYAVVDPDAVPGSDSSTTDMLEPVTSLYMKQNGRKGGTGDPGTANPVPRGGDTFHKEFTNGFGKVCGIYDAWIVCDPGPVCKRSATCTETGVIVSCMAKRSPKPPELINGKTCRHSVAFIGYGGFPSIEFDATELKFSISGFGWEYYNDDFDQTAECLIQGHIQNGGALPEGVVRGMHHYPNPFNPMIEIAFTLQRPTDVRVNIYNLKGEQVSLLNNGTLDAGQHTLAWDGTNDRGEPVDSGVYFYTVVTREERVTRKIALIK